MAVCLCNIFLAVPSKARKRASDSMRVQLQVVINDHAEVGSWTHVLLKCCHYSEPLSHLSYLLLWEFSAQASFSVYSVFPGCRCKRSSQKVLLLDLHHCDRCITSKCNKSLYLTWWLLLIRYFITRMRIVTNIISETFYNFTQF